MSRIPETLAPEFEKMTKVVTGAAVAIILTAAAYAAFGNQEPAQPEPTNATELSH
ncbi:MAG: hypothetical protein H6861_07130 [Rhodospirillales bacterium]|nr:hypothetical protein [Rhodospirillales bacterium]